VAVVTGAGRGIGEATARLLAQEGARVAALDLDGGAATSAASVIGAAGGTAVGLACDVADRMQVEAAIGRAAEELGSIDILVSNAGVTRDNLIFRMTDHDWNSVVDVHLTGAFHCARAVQSYMVEQRRGKIVFLSSTSALGKRGQTNYAAAKAGLQGMTRSLAIELGPFGINVNAVAPGFVETAMTAATAERLGRSFEDHKKAAIEQIPLGRIGSPRDIANVIAFLVSDDASYVSGQIVYAAGGPRG
jgi:3-oxoacyl-[acyl-carrier protein] reductase